MFNGVWCGLCLPKRHESGISVPPKQLDSKWHEARGQRPGKVLDYAAVRYALDPRPDKGLQ